MRGSGLLLLSLGLVTPASAGSGPSRVSTWPQMRGDIASTGFAPNVKAVSPEASIAVGTLRAQAWGYKTGAGIFSTPIVGDHGETLVGSADRYFYSVDQNGKLIWKYLTGEIFDSAAALTEDGVVWAPSADGTLYALNVTTGKQLTGARTSFKAHHATGMKDQHEGTHCFAAEPQGGASTWFEGNVKLTSDGTMFAGNDDQRLYSVDSNGKQRFAFFPGPIPFGSVWSHAAVLEKDGKPDKVFFGALNTNFYGVSGADGSCLWQALLWSIISSSPAIDAAANRIFVGSWDTYLYALDANTGDKVYKVKTRDHIYASPALDKSRDRVYVTSADGCLYAITASTGKVEWTYDTLLPIRSSPSISSDGVVFFGNAGSVIYAINPDGTRHFSIDVTRDPSRKGINSSPALGASSVMVGAFDGHIWSVGYDHCTSDASNPGCSVEPHGDVPKEDGAYLYWASNGGGALHGPIWGNSPGFQPKDIKLPVTAAFGAPLLYLQVRSKGEAISVGIEEDGLKATLQPGNIAVTALLTGTPVQYILVKPSAVLTAGEYTLEVSLSYKSTTDSSDAATITSKVQFPVLQAAPKSPSLDVFELRHMAPFIPTVLTSLNQIGFDSIYMLGKVLYTDPKTGTQVALTVGAQPVAKDGTLIVDPKTDSRMVVNMERKGSAMQAKGSHFRMITGGPVINADSFELSADLAEDGSFSNSTILVQTGCTDGGAMGYGILLLGFCNPQRKLVVTGTMAGKSATYPADALPAKVSNVSPFKVGGIFESTVSAQVTLDPPLKAAEHLTHIVIVDEEKGEALDLDYVEATKAIKDSSGNIAGVELTLPLGTSLPKSARAIFTIDLHIVASEALKQADAIVV